MTLLPQDTTPEEDSCEGAVVVDEIWYVDVLVEVALVGMGLLESVRIVEEMLPVGVGSSEESFPAVGETPKHARS